MDSTIETIPSTTTGAPSIIHGVLLSEEPGLGALTLPGYFREVTGRFGPREALVLHEPGGVTTRWTYAELWDQAMAVARSLAACGVGKGSHVGVMMTNRPEWLAAVFGVGLAGGLAVALSTFSTPAELEALLKASAVSTLLFERRAAKKDFAAMLHEIEPAIATAAPGRLASVKLPFLQCLAMIGDGPPEGAIESWAQFRAHGERIAPSLVEAAAAAVTPADPGLLLFSSGSTGKPKGVLNAHRGATLQCWRWARLYDFKPGDDVVAWSPNGFFWSGNFAIGLGATLACGGRIVLQTVFDAAEALDLIERERISFAYAWPHQWAQIEAAPNWASADLSSLHYLDVAVNLRERHPTIATGWREPRWSYGGTETFTIISAFAANSPVELAGDSNGEALPGNTIRIVDPLTGQVLPRGESGEIVVKGPTLMLGYLGIPLDQTLDADGFYHTGDGGFVDDHGRLVFQGRLNDIIKTGGANVSPVEVDNVLATCPGVKVCKTVGVPHETLGEMVVACVAPEPARPLTEAGVRDFLRAQLASYKVPRRVLFVAEADLAFTGSAKVKSDAARALAAARLQAEEGGA